MIGILIFITLVSAATAKPRQFRQAEVQAPVQVVHPDVEEEPTKLTGLVPEWRSPLMQNYTEKFNRVNEKLAALDTQKNLNLGLAELGLLGALSNPLSPFSTLFDVINRAGCFLTTSAASVYSFASSFAVPILVTVVFYAGIFYLIQLALKVIAMLCRALINVFIQRKK